MPVHSWFLPMYIFSFLYILHYLYIHIFSTQIHPLIMCEFNEKLKLCSFRDCWQNLIESFHCFCISTNAFRVKIHAWVAMKIWHAWEYPYVLVFFLCIVCIYIVKTKSQQSFVTKLQIVWQSSKILWKNKKFVRLHVKRNWICVKMFIVLEN